jgi:UDP-GlcNAc:undecaprenyl-phosphate GlcNAc-1-phosphate transferase
MLDFSVYDIIYIIFFVLSIIFSVLINGIMLRFTKTLGMRQPENMIRWATTSKPSIGGISFYILFLISASAYAILRFSNQNEFDLPLIGLILSSSFGFLLGLADDAYNTVPSLKFAGQLICAILLVSTGIMIDITGYFAIDALFTVFWVIGIMNSINMLDNMDGITTSVSLSILVCGLVILAMQNAFFSVLTFLIIGVCGALIGFLFYNLNPSKMYMGDTGSQFLGVFLSGVSIILMWNHRQSGIEGFQFKQFIIPILSFAIPIIDTATVFIHRIRQGHSPFIGGRDHTTHHLAYHGFKDRQVFYIFFLSSLIMNALAILAIIYFSEITSLATFIIFMAYIILFMLMQFIYLTAKPPQQPSTKVN